MDFILLTISPYGNYFLKKFSSEGIANLGLFLSRDVGCYDKGWPTFKDWAVNDSLGMEVGGNATFLEKEGDCIYITDAYSQKKVPTEIKISRQRFVQLLDNWEEKVCKHKPKTVIIKHENDQFIIETSNE